MCLLPFYRTTLSATRSHSRNDQLVWRVGRSEPKGLRIGRRTLKINPKFYYNNTGYLFWLANITGRLRTLIQFVVSWDPCVAVNIAVFIVFLIHFHFFTRSLTVYTSRAPKYVTLVSFQPHKFANPPCRYYWFLKIKIHGVLSSCGITFVPSFMRIRELVQKLKWVTRVH